MIISSVFYRGAPRLFPKISHFTLDGDSLSINEISALLSRQTLDEGSIILDARDRYVDTSQLPR